VNGEGDAGLDAFFDEVYLETTAPLLAGRMTLLEAEVLVSLVAMRPGGRYLDLGCGHGRHLRVLADIAPSVRFLGVDRSAPALAWARRGTHVGTGARAHVGTGEPHVGTGGHAHVGTPPSLIRGDLRALPLKPQSLDGAYAWYSGVLLFDDATNLAVLRAIRASLRPGARFVHDGANPARLATDPVAEVERDLPGVGRVTERCRFDPATGIEHGWRRLEREDGTTSEGSWSVLQPDPEALTRLLERAGFEVWSLTDELGRPFDATQALDLVAVAGRSPDA